MGNLDLRMGGVFGIKGDSEMDFREFGLVVLQGLGQNCKKDVMEDSFVGGLMIWVFRKICVNFGEYKIRQLNRI